MITAASRQLLLHQYLLPCHNIYAEISYMVRDKLDSAILLTLKVGRLPCNDDKHE
ncbi:MAG: hypothetical protein ACLSCV_01375 [Acutalibacteraceae bacterium]